MIKRPHGHQAKGAALAAAMALLAALLLYIPPSWNGDLGPAPDAEEYAISARNLARHGSYSISLLQRPYPPQYPPGFPLLIAPVYWMPGTTLADGTVGAVAWGTAGVVLVCGLGWAVRGPIAGLVAGSALLLSSTYREWSHQIMSETATVALVALAALLLQLASRTDRQPPRRLLVLALGGVIGLAILVRLPNLTLLAALPLTLLVARRARPAGRSELMALAVGPCVALAALAAFNQLNFGSVFGNGYSYWYSRWYGSLGKTFAWSYAVEGPALVDHYVSDIPNLTFYPYVGQFLFPRLLSAMAILGMALLVILERRKAPIAMIYLGLFGALSYALYALYAYQSRRFLAPYLPFMAVCMGVAVQAGARWANERWRLKGWPRALLFAAFGGLLVVGLQSAVREAVSDSALYHVLVLKSPEPPSIAWNAWTVAAYRTVANDGIVVTDASVLMLEEAGVLKANQIVPLSNLTYWRSWPPLASIPSFLEQCDALVDAARRGTALYIDSYSIETLAQQQGPQSEIRQALQRFDLEPVNRDGPVVIYRLRPKP